MVDVSGPSMAGKIVLVTGGTGGIGKGTASGLAVLGADLAVTGRDRARTEAAAESIRAASGNGGVRAFAADLSVQSEVRRLAADVLDTYPRLDVLVNNVGGFWAHRHVTADGLERTFALNHLAGFLLTNLLLDRLKASAPSRVVAVSSGAQSMGTIDFDDLQGERRYSGQRAYNQSKLANVVFTFDLARRLEGSGVTATVLHPGVVRTAFSQRRGPRSLPQVAAAAGPAVHEVADRGGEDLDLPRLVPGRGGRQRYVLRQGQGQVREQVRVRLRDGCPPVAGQRRPGGAAVHRLAAQVTLPTLTARAARRAALSTSGRQPRRRSGRAEPPSTQQEWMAAPVAA